MFIGSTFLTQFIFVIFMFVNIFMVGNYANSGFIVETIGKVSRTINLIVLLFFIVYNDLSLLIKT